MGCGFGIRTVLAIALLTFVVSLARVLATPLTPFRHESQAQRHCPDDTVVWLDFRKGIYYSKGQKYYARGFDGSFARRNEARDSGYRRSLLGLRLSEVCGSKREAVSSRDAP
jgi:hypothetical protein